jgi:hypothetical protein
VSWRSEKSQQSPPAYDEVIFGRSDLDGRTINRNLFHLLFFPLCSSLCILPDVCCVTRGAEMPKSLEWVALKCLDCGHEAHISREIIESVIADKLTMVTLVQAWGRFRCSSCSSRSTRMAGHDGCVLLDASNLTNCAQCGDPILVPRLAAVPGTRLCSTCATTQQEHQGRPLRQEEWPPPPAHLSQCPRCKGATTVRENSRTGNRFVGCMSYPRCDWTSNIPSNLQRVRTAQLFVDGARAGP